MLGCGSPGQRHETPAAPTHPSFDAAVADSDDGPRYAPADLQADIAALVATLEDAHPNLYHGIDKRRFATLTARVRDGIERPLSARELYHRVARLIAHLNEAHTFVFPPIDSLEADAEHKPVLLPLSVTIAEGSVLVDAVPPQGSLDVGARVVTIDGRSTDQLLARWRSETSGPTVRYRDATIARRIHQLAWLGGIEAPFELTVRGGDGTERTVSMPGVTADQRRRILDAAHAAAPWSFELAADGIGVLELRSMNDLEGFEALLRDAFSELRERDAPGLIVDLRDCPGGDSRLGDALLRYITDKPYRLAARKEWKASASAQAALAGKGHAKPILEAPTGATVISEVSAKSPPAEPLRFEGPVCFLIGSFTFSSAIMLANAAQDFDLATLIGHPTEGRPNNYGEVLEFTLPTSGLRIGVSTARWVRANGDGNDRNPVVPNVALPDDATPEQTMAAARAWIVAQAKQ